MIVMMDKAKIMEIDWEIDWDIDDWRTEKGKNDQTTSGKIA